MHETELQPAATTLRGRVLILNSSDDVVEMLRVALEDRGIIAVSAHIDQVRRSHVDLAAIVTAQKPTVAIYDVTPPYDRSWLYLESLRREGPLKDIPVVVTTTNQARLRQFVSTNEPVIEIFGKPYDIFQVVDCVEQFLR